MKKYEMIKEESMYRIIALRDFGNVKEGEKGGLIEKEANLSHEGDCWVYDNAKVYGDARVYGYAWVYGDARVCSDAKVYGNAQVCEYAWVCGNAKVYNDAQVYGDAWVSGNAWVYGNAQVYGDAWVYGDAQVYGDARVSGDARVFELHIVQYGHIKDTSIKALVASSLNVYPVKGIYCLYKRVNKIDEGKYASCYDNSFLYRDGKIAKAKNINEDAAKSCASGLHVSTPFYWNDGDTLIAVEVNDKDIICCQEGKLRVRKLKVIGEVK